MDTGTGYLYLYLQVWRVYGAISVPAGIDSIHYLYLQVYLQITCGLPVYLQITCGLPVCLQVTCELPVYLYTYRLSAGYISGKMIIDYILRLIIIYIQ
jgi:hypothetical protein